MKCPTRNLLFKGEYCQEQYEDCDCLKEECAWWMADITMCAVKEIALELRHGQHRLADMIEKMPQQ